MPIKKYIAVVPSSDEFLNNVLFQRGENNDDRNLHNFVLKQYLYDKSFEVKTIDLYDDYSILNVVIFEKIDFNYLKIFNFQYKQVLLILLSWEPEVVTPLSSYKSLIKLSKWFDYVLTWNDKLVDHDKFYKINSPQNLISINSSNSYSSFTSRKLLTQISSNIHSTHSSELYTLRKKLNVMLSKILMDEFDYYGRGWELNSSYKGSVKNKLEILKNYKFSICFENMIGEDGYITEKIFDCFKAGVVPVYLGARNVANYIPENCFIDYQNFNNIFDFIDYIKNLDYKKWKEYILNSKRYLGSNLSKQFSIEYFISKIDFVIQLEKKENPFSINDLIYLWINLTGYSIRNFASSFYSKIRSSNDFFKSLFK